jgi:hypothetical protein
VIVAVGVSSEIISQSNLDSIEFLHSSSKRRSDKFSDETAATKLTDAEEAATGNVSWGIYFRYFKSIGLWLSIVGFVSNILFQGVSVYSNSKGAS